MVGESLSLCITTWQRDKMTVNSFSKVLEDPRITEIVIVDDASDDIIWRRLQRSCNHPKIKLFRNQKNKGCYFNKQQAVKEATSDWVILFDSDNTLTKDYLDALFSVEWKKYTIYAPEFARPVFDYRHFTGSVITKANAGSFIGKKMFDCMINTCNYFVNKEEYLRIFDSNIEPWTADTIFHNYNWLKAGNTIHVLKGMQYDHLIHDQSHYKKYVHKTGNLFREIEKRIKMLK